MEFAMPVRCRRLLPPRLFFFFFFTGSNVSDFFSFFFLSFFWKKTHAQAYEELGKLGEGTYGTVLRCRHRGTKELVAVKRFKESGEENQVSGFCFSLAAAAAARERASRERREGGREGGLSQATKPLFRPDSSRRNFHRTRAFLPPFFAPGSKGDLKKLPCERKKGREKHQGRRERRKNKKQKRRGGHFAAATVFLPFDPETLRRDLSPSSLLHSRSLSLSLFLSDSLFLARSPTFRSPSSSNSALPLSLLSSLERSKSARPP